MRQDKFSLMMKRRRLLYLLGLSPLLPTMLAGCGGGGGGNSNNQSATFTGTINTREIGGAGLMVQSAYAQDVTPGFLGKFSVPVSETRVHALFVTDDAGAVRGMTLCNLTQLALPQAGREVNAATTALSLAYMTPGVMELDASKAEARVRSVVNLSSFISFQNLLASQLALQPLDVLTATAEYKTLLSSAVTEWQETTTRKRSRAGVVVDTARRGGIEIRVTSAANPSGTILELSNWIWRYVQVTERGLLAGGQIVYSKAIFDGLKCLPGPSTVDVASVFSGAVFQASTGTTTVDLSAVAMLEYWVQGVGFGRSEYEVPPPDVSVDTVDAIAWTFTKYVLIPAFSFLSPILSSQANVVMTYVLASDQLLSAVLSLTNPVNPMEPVEPGHLVPKSTETALTQFALTFLTNEDLIAALASSVGKDATSLINLINPISKLLALGNLVVALAEWFLVPSCTKLVVRGEADGNVIVS